MKEIISIVRPISMLGNDQDKLHFCHSHPKYWTSLINLKYDIDQHVMKNIYSISVELLQNAIFNNKYDDSSLTYEIDVAGKVICIRVKNKVTKEQKEILRDKIEKYTDSTDIIKEYYRAMSDNKTGGLGLMTILVQAKCKLKMYEEEMGYIQIEARMTT
jgi:hypothetical protein